MLEKPLEYIIIFSMKRILQIYLLLTAITVLSFSCGDDDMKSDLPVVPYVDLKRYIGKWFEISRYYNKFQKGCVATTATYSIREDGDIKVLNECRQESLDGEFDRAEGKAWVVDEKSNAKLKVQFFWPFRGDYWIIDLGKNYEYAVVSDPSRKYLWILSRTPQMDQAVYETILRRLVKLGFDTSKLIKTEQPVLP